MSFIRKPSEILAMDTPSFEEIAALFQREWLYTKEDALKIIHCGKLDPYLKTERVLSLLCSTQTPGGDQLIRELIKRGADVNVQTSNGTALHSAAWARNPQAINTLLEFGANPLLKNKSGQYPLNCAVMQYIDGGPSWAENREANKRDEINRVKSIVKTLIIKGGNDPYQVYASNEFQDKSAISDCSNLEVLEVMKTANLERKAILQNKDNPLSKNIAAQQLADAKANKDAIMKKFQKNAAQLFSDAKIELGTSFCIYDPKKPLILQVKKKAGEGIRDRIYAFGIPYSYGMANFELIKVAHRYFDLSAKMHSGFDKRDDGVLYITDRTSFNIKDHMTGQVLLDNISEDDIDGAMKNLYEYLTGIKKAPMPSFFAAPALKSKDAGPSVAEMSSPKI